MKLHAVLKMECVGLAVRAQFPLLRDIRGDFVLLIPLHQALEDLLHEVDSRSVFDFGRVVRRGIGGQRVSKDV